MAEFTPGASDPATVGAVTRGAEPRLGLVTFACVTALALLVTHALAYIQHEYSHSVTAWLLGFKANPLAIDYGKHPLQLSNLLLQQQIDEGVEYQPIFHSGHGFAEAAIALAGWTSNVVLYLVCAGILKRRLQRMRPALAIFLFWLALMEAANLWSYSPVRTITWHADMANAAQGLGISTWTLFPFVVLPTLWVAWDFFKVLMPRVLAAAFGGDVLRRVFATAIACFVYFGFFGGVSIIADYGEVSAVISILSVFVFLPVAVMVTLAEIPLERPAPAS
jgi:hypothetical protein